MAKGSRPFTNEVSTHTGVSSESKQAGPSQAWGDGLHFPGVPRRREPGGTKILNPVTRARRIQASVTSVILPGIQKTQNQKRQIWKDVIGCQKANSRLHRRHLDATSP